MRSGSVGAPCDRCVIVGAISRCGGNELLWRCVIEVTNTPSPVASAPWGSSSIPVASWWAPGPVLEEVEAAAAPGPVTRAAISLAEPSPSGGTRSLWRRSSPKVRAGDVIFFFFVFLVMRFCWCLSVFMRALHAPVKCTICHVTEQGCNPMPSPQEWMELCVLDIKIHTEASVLSLTNTTFSPSAVFLQFFCCCCVFQGDGHLPDTALCSYSSYLSW